MSALAPARIRERFEDFVVEELPAYAPSGAGEHVFLRFTKRGHTTPAAVRAIAQGLRCDPRDAGHAGMKDKFAVATQTISLLAPRGVDPRDLARRALELSIDGITILSATPHEHKIKPGHLAGNRFALVLRGIPRHRVGEVTAAFDRIAREGVPNAFGEQRFGARGDNLARALAWLRGRERGPRDRRMQRLMWSSVQSAIFNRVLDVRVADGTWSRPIEGDVLKVRATGGLFVCTDVQTDRARAETGEVSPTGPIVGARMLWPEAVAAELERRVATETFGADFDLASTRRLGEGSRRPLRLWVNEMRCDVRKAGEAGEAGQAGEESDDRREPSDDSEGNTAASVRVYFVLPKGAYATTVLRAAVATDETRGAMAALDGEAMNEGEGEEEEASR
jgi:tRNA pseudouridine13 synthase